MPLSGLPIVYVDCPVIRVVPNCGKSPLENLKPADVQNVVKTIRASGSLKTLIMRIGVTAEAE